MICGVWRQPWNDCAAELAIRSEILTRRTDPTRSDDLLTALLGTERGLGSFSWLLAMIAYGTQTSSNVPVLSVPITGS